MRSRRLYARFVSSWPAVIHLTGPPAVGKLTIAAAVVEEAARRGRHAILLDNHELGVPCS